MVDEICQFCAAGAGRLQVVVVVVVVLVAVVAFDDVFCNNNHFDFT